MKRSTKLIIGLAVLAVVIGAYFGVKFLTQEDTPTTEDTSIVLYETDSDVTRIQINYDGEEIVLEKGSEWALQGDSEFELNTETIDLMVSDLSQITATRLISEEPEDITQFGLDEPQCTIEFCVNDSVTKILIGNYNQNVSGYYVQMDGESPVYLMSTIFPEDFMIHKADLEAPEPTEAPTEEPTA